MCHLHIYNTLLGIVWGSKCQWTWSCSHLCWNIGSPSYSRKLWQDPASTFHSNLPRSILFEIISLSISQRHKVGIRFSSLCTWAARRQMLLNIVDHKAIELVKSYEKVSVRNDDLLCILKSAFTGWVKKADQMAAAHVADFVNSVIPKQLFWIRYCTYLMKLAISLGVIYPLPDLSILWNAAYGSNELALHKFCLQNSIRCSLSPVCVSSFASFFLV